MPAKGERKAATTYYSVTQRQTEERSAFQRLILVRRLSYAAAINIYRRRNCRLSDNKMRPKSLADF